MEWMGLPIVSQGIYERNDVYVYNEPFQFFLFYQLISQT